MAFFMPLSLFVTNATIILIVVNWVVEGDFSAKLARIRENKGILVFCSIFIVHLIWLINTSNFDYALNDLRIKLPLLALPIALGTSKPISEEWRNRVLASFVSGVLVATILGFAAKSFGTGGNFRALSLFVSNIRLSLMICMSIFILLYFVVKKIFFTKRMFWGAAILCVWLLFFLSMIQSITGYVCFFVVLEAVLISVAKKSEKKSYRCVSISMSIVVPLVIAGFVTYTIVDFYTPTGNNEQLATTANGVPYDDIESDGTIENGNVVWRNVSKSELQTAWAERSSIPLDSLDRKGQSIYSTLVRYMTSLGLTKDAEGVRMLTKEDVENVEGGETNYRFAKKGGLLCRIYVTIWEFDVYRKTGNCNGHSVTQRVEYMKYGCKLAMRNFFTGTGEGDVNDEYQALYEEEDCSLDENNRNRAHNQFLTFFIAFGVIGFLICVFAWFYPVVSDWKSCSYFFLIFFLIATVSMFSDDTLETSTGAVFVAYFYSLLRWTNSETKENDGKQRKIHAACN